METVKKFSFDREFDRGATSPFVQKKPETTLTLSQHEATLREAESQAFLRGHVEGANAARTEEQARLARAIEALTATLSQTAARLGHIEAKASSEALKFALEFSTMLSGTLVSQSPTAPIEAAARKVFGDLRGVPHVAVRVSPDLVEPAREKLSRIARDIGLDAKMIVLGEPEIMTGDCRIEWADGGIIVDHEQLVLKLNAAVARALDRDADDHGNDTPAPAFPDAGIEQPADLD